MSVHRLQVPRTRDRLFLVVFHITELIVRILIVSSDRRQEQTTSASGQFCTTSHHVCKSWPIIEAWKRVVEADATIWNS
jgi:hypothetical protein